jgi:hypothetical protein
MQSARLNNIKKRDIRIVFLVFTLIFSMLAKKWYPSYVSYALIVAAVLLAVFLVAAPMMLRPLFLLWMKLAQIMGRMNTQILLFLFYIAVLTPAGIIMRLIGFDPMHRKMREKETYWEPYHIVGTKDPQRYERQF